MSKDDHDDLSAGIIAQDIHSLDLGYGAVPLNYSNISSGYGTDTITMSTGTMTGSITLPSTTITNIGASGNYYTTTGAGASYNWANTSTTPGVNITGTGIDMAAGTDISIDGKSLKTFMNKMEERLAILIPDPAKLEKFEALKKAYEHYKLMESLCQEQPKEED